MSLPCHPFAFVRAPTFVIAFAFVLVAAGCPEPDGDPPEPQPDAVAPAVVVPDPVAESVSGAAGGTVTIGEGELDIPADAVEGDVEITVTATAPDETEGLPEEGEVEGLVYDFGPDGLAFDAPADLELPLPEDIGANESVAIAYLDEELGEWVGVPTIIRGGGASAKIHHFTKYAVIKDLEAQCNVTTCGQLSELDGYWRLVTPESGSQCAFAKNPPAACVTNFTSKGSVSDARLLFGDDEVNGTLELNDKTKFTVPVGCEEDVFVGDYAGASCAPNGDSDAGVLEDGGAAPVVVDLPPTCVRTAGGCECVVDGGEELLFIGGEIGETDDGKIALSWTDDATGISTNDELYFCRTGDFLEMYGVAQGSTMALSYVLVGSDSDEAPIPLDAPFPRSQVFVVPEFTLGPSVANILYGSNLTDTATSVAATYRDDTGVLHDLGVVAHMQAHKVTKLAYLVSRAIDERGIFNTRRGVLTLTTRGGIEYFVSEYRNGRRLRHQGFEERDVVERVQHFPYNRCGAGTLTRIGVYNPSDLATPISLSLQASPSDDAIDTSALTWSGLDATDRVPPHSSAYVDVCGSVSEDRFSASVSSPSPIRAWVNTNIRGQAMFYAGTELGEESRQHPGVKMHPYSTVFGAIQNVSQDDAEVTIDVTHPDGSATTAYAVSVPAGATRRLPAGIAEASPRGRSHVAIRQESTTAKLITFVGSSHFGQNRTEAFGFAIDAQAPAWVIPYMQYSPNASQTITATSAEPTSIRYRAVDDQGNAFVGTLSESLPGNWGTTDLHRPLKTALQNQGFDDGKIAYVIESVDETPILVTARYNVGGATSTTMRPRLPIEPCNEQTSLDSDNDGTVDCLESCPNDEDKLLPGLCGCGVEETDPCPAPPDAGPLDAGAFDAGDLDAGTPNLDGGDLDGGFTDLDAGPTDAGFDAGPPDAGPPDAGPRDAGPPDAGPPDAGPPDAGPPDAGPPDAGPPDAGLPDAGPPDAGPPDAGPPDAGVDAGPQDAGPPPPPGECGDETNESSCNGEGHCFWNNNTCGDNPAADCTVFEESGTCDEHGFCFWNGQNCNEGGATCDLYPTQESCESNSGLCAWDGAACGDPVNSCDAYVDRPACENDTTCDWDGAFCGEDPFGPDDCGAFNGDQFGCESSSGCLYHQDFATCHDSCYQFDDDVSCDASGGSCGWDFNSNLCEPTGGGSGDCGMYFDEFACDADPGCRFDFMFFECVPN